MRKYFVHRYKYSHDRKRKKFKKWLKLGYVSVLGTNKDGCLYQSEFEIKTRYFRKQHPSFEIILPQSR